MIELSDDVKARLRAFNETPRADRWKQPKAVRAALIDDLARHDYSAADMGAIFGCTRNAVIGFADRQGVKLGGHVKHSIRSTKRARPTTRPLVPAPDELVTPTHKPPPRPKRAPKSTIEKTARAPAPIVKPNAVLTFKPRPSPVHILAADYRHCRFPLWSDERTPTVAEMFFCGREKEDILKPYCAQCAGSGLSYIAPERRRAA
ncbi:GcrA family cell cycle regulator [Mesorhizobium sp. M0152]|uniref:GcrA family cell cycle regulator n=1 Tax=Mesorhizobium sp. M0152 TaxID=2956898 RepID=UPI003337F4D7